MANLIELFSFVFIWWIGCVPLAIAAFVWIAAAINKMPIVGYTLVCNQQSTNPFNFIFIIHFIANCRICFAFILCLLQAISKIKQEAANQLGNKIELIAFFVGCLEWLLCIQSIVANLFAFLPQTNGQLLIAGLCCRCHSIPAINWFNNFITNQSHNQSNYAMHGKPPYNQQQICILPAAGKERQKCICCSHSFANCFDNWWN